jgi:predicted tellurium resistance membrane protein TerC
MDFLTDPQTWLGLATLTALEIVLGVDNIIFIAILSAKVAHARQESARRTGMFLAMFTRIGLLLSLSMIMRLTRPWFSIFSAEISGRDLILMIGGLFLLVKATLEIHEKLEGSEHHGEGQENRRKVSSSFLSVILQIAVLDIVFSLDSVITAIGLANHLGVMVTAIVIAVIFMMFFVGAISQYVERHPTIKILALSFLLLIGMTLIADGFHLHIPKGYIYFAMAFSVFVEMLNLRIRKMHPAPLQLRDKVELPEQS